MVWCIKEVDSEAEWFQLCEHSFDILYKLSFYKLAVGNVEEHCFGHHIVQNENAALVEKKDG